MLSAPIRRRIQALKKIQLESLHLEAEFFRDVYDLEYKYHSRFSAHHNTVSSNIFSKDLIQI